MMRKVLVKFRKKIWDKNECGIKLIMNCFIGCIKRAPNIVRKTKLLRFMKET